MRFLSVSLILSRLRLAPLLALALTLALAASHPVWAADVPQPLSPPSGTCAKGFERFTEDYKGLRIEGLKTTDETPLFSSLFNDPKAVFLMVEDRQHYAIRIGDRTYNGQVLGQPWVEAGPKGDEMPKGLLVRIEGLPDGVFTQLREEADHAAQFPSYTCVHFACTRLAKAGVAITELKKQDEVPVRLARTLDAILRSGFSGPEGQKIGTTLVLNSELSIQQLSKRLEHYDAGVERLNERRFKRGGLDGAQLALFEPEVAAIIVAEAKKRGLRVNGAPAAPVAVLVLIPATKKVRIESPRPEASPILAPAVPGAAPGVAQ